MAQFIAIWCLFFSVVISLIVRYFCGGVIVYYFVTALITPGDAYELIGKILLVFVIWLVSRFINRIGVAKLEEENAIWDESNR